jgi:hypothetical protein
MKPEPAQADVTVMDSPRRWVAAVLCEERAVELGSYSFAELIETAEYEGVLPLLDWRLRSNAAYSALPDEFRQPLGQRARASAAQSMLDAREIARVSVALDEAGFQTLLLKGPAFARWLYPQPYLRISSDIDLLFASRSEADRAATVAERLGYELAFSPGGMVYEMSCRLVVDGEVRSELDVHSRLVNQEAYADRLGFDELWLASLALPGLPARVRGLSPVHALLHACMHRAHDLSLHRPDRLKWLYDIHLLIQSLDRTSWALFVAAAREKELCGVCLRSFDDSADWFASVIPEDVLSDLRQAAAAEAIDYRQLGDWRYMQWQSFKALPDMRARLRWLSERLLPSRSHMQELHGGSASLPTLMLRRLLRGIARWRGRE